MTVRLRFTQPGPQTSVQDLGRTGFQAYGVPVCGALDPVALRLANALVGNAETLAALECRLAGPHFTVEGGTARLAVAGADVTIDVTFEGETRRFPAWRAIDVPADASVRVGALSRSGCAVLAVAGGIEVPVVLGSRATDLKGGFGGYQGRPVGSGDVLPVGPTSPHGRCLELPSPPELSASGPLRVVLGPQSEAFTEEGIATFLGSTYRVSRDADRMGMRLDGPPLAFRVSADIVSDGIANGSIQVPGSGLPIVLLADHQTIGGYAKVATVISSDLPAAGRLLPGAELRFTSVSVEEAEVARRTLEDDISRLIASFVPVREAAHVDEAALLTENLISGVVSAWESE
ncbi:biotin-dependent carboxyltransferase family protein [Ancylobacter pratisalsi]|uniref:Biotin-dependent carboxyltransferase family protein n=1 Tax=Ancylobacter pratisalsi TaxID=1745854 RepID=A0A6P1YGY1_9HYPH|nr:biotin-dependent carboxyltransferase family protein [Ancylobacter pratisalsi]QIB32558.1 biotin-dependent carboxyltransferase family protein [Ancylobacter pratisalsi]